MDTEQELRLAADDHARGLQQAIGARVVVLSLFAGNGRHLFIGSAGLPPRLEGQWEIPEMEMLCQHLETSGGQLIVDDVRTESDFASHPLLAELDVHAYAGWHVPDRDGRPIGILAATADRPRTWSSAELTILMERAHACGPTLAAVLASGVVPTRRAG